MFREALKPAGEAKVNLGGAQLKRLVGCPPHRVHELKKPRRRAEAQARPQPGGLVGASGGVGDVVARIRLVSKEKHVRVGADKLPKFGRGHGVRAGVKLVFVEAAQRVEPPEPEQVVDEQAGVEQGLAPQPQEQHPGPLHGKVALGPQAKRVLRGAQGQAAVELGRQLRVEADGFGAHGALGVEQKAPARKEQVVEAGEGVANAVGIVLRVQVLGEGRGVLERVEKRAALLGKEADGYVTCSRGRMVVKSLVCL